MEVIGEIAKHGAAETSAAQVIFICVLVVALALVTIAIVKITLRCKSYFDKQFLAITETFKEELEQDRKAIRRIEFHLAARDGFQPGVDPIQIIEADRLHARNKSR